MANPTTNYGFVMPTSTDLVTDLPADFDVFGQAVDNQMLTNANAAIAKTIVDAKGDLIGATAADIPARLAVGTNGQVLTADSTAATGLAWATPAGGGMTVLASGSLPTGAAVLTLSSISASYKDLRLVVRNPYPMGGLKLNNDSTSNIYSNAGINMTNSTPSVAGEMSTQIYASWNSLVTTQQYNEVILNVFDYANTTAHKLWTTHSIGVQASTNAIALSFFSGAYRSTSAINRIDFTAPSNFSGGTYILYGVN
jgi:hypothetical protein